MPRLFFALVVVEHPDDPLAPPRRFAAMGVTAFPPDAVPDTEAPHVDVAEPPRPSAPPAAPPPPSRATLPPEETDDARLEPA